MGPVSIVARRLGCADGVVRNGHDQGSRSPRDGSGMKRLWHSCEWSATESGGEGTSRRHRFERANLYVTLRGR